MKIIVLENLDFMWLEKDLIHITEMWKKGNSVLSIAKYFKRDPDEVVLALLHLAKEKKIKKRNGGLFANFADK